MSAIPQAAVVLVLRDDSPILFTGRIVSVLAVTNRKYGGLSLPGGKVDDGEDPREAAARELREEVDVLVRPADLSLVARYANTMRAAPCSVCDRPWGPPHVHGDGCAAARREDRLVSVYHAAAARGRPRMVEDGTVPSWASWEELLEASPFRGFYSAHFPDGVRHLRSTHLLPG